MGTILLAIAIMTGIGAFFGVGLAIANKYLKVEEDPRLDIIEDLLPGSNCGACGQPGCRAFAEELIGGRCEPSGCTVNSPEGVDKVADFLGVDAGEAEKRVARLHCAGGLGQARQIAEYQGYGSCSAAHLIGGGGKGCSWGCLGLADCEASCDFDAIKMNGQRLPVVDPDLCTACNDCVEACPRDLFELLPIGQNIIVQCNAPLEGDEAMAVCSVACDACGRCAQDAAPGLIHMANNLPVVDYSAGGPAEPDATFRCPTGAIKWIEDGQFKTARLVQLTTHGHGREDNRE